MTATCWNCGAAADPLLESPPPWCARCHSRVATFKGWVARVLFAVGAVMAVYGGFQWWNGQRVFARMRPTTCTVVIKTIEGKFVGDGRRSTLLGSRRPGLVYTQEAHHLFAHTVDGRRFTFKQEKLPR